MNESNFDASFSQFEQQMHGLPPAEQANVADLAQETRLRQEKLRETVKTLQESLDHLRLSVKYLVFDLEATRRENQYLRKLLDASDK